MAILAGLLKNARLRPSAGSGQAEMNGNGEIMKIRIGFSLLLMAAFLSGTFAEAARIKDIAEIGGVRDNQLIGYGLVVGLAGTGDDVKNGFTKETLANLLSRQGLSTKDRTLKADNIAAAMVTANLPAFSRIGTRIDVSVSSIGDAKSLQGGTLLMTPLRGADGEIYAVAQGPLTLGGFSAGGAGGSVTKNHTSVGFIANGAFVERELKHELDRNRAFTLNLHSPDFTTAKRLTEIVAQNNPYVDARQVDSRTVALKLKAAFSGTMIDLIPQIEGLDVPVDSTAVVVMNEKTGTVVMGENVRISTVAIAHGNLSVQIKEEQKVSQPLPFAPAPPAGSAPATPDKSGTIVAPGGQTVVTTDKTVGVGEEQKQLMVVSKGVTIQDVVKALNAIGVTPRDLITILQTIKAAGALQADLRLI
jgi:flagellar P-ring protein precursor FlgI